MLRVLILLSLTLAATASNEKGKKFLEENSKKDGVVVLPSGLQYKVLRRGSGQFHPTADSSCECHYAGTLIDGTEFDSSYKRGSPTSFAPNQVIKGWTEAMQLMVEGDKWEMYIPSELGYGDRGSPPKIGGGEVLVFQMEIIQIKGGKVPAVTCNPVSLEGCNEQEVKYVEFIKEWSADKMATELKRLAGLNGAQMKPELLAWLGRRKNILAKRLEAVKEKDL